MMRYHNITKDDMLNGDGLRVVLWVAGCSHGCRECQNPITWDPNGGLPFTDSERAEIFAELDKDYISGITFSGGDPLHPSNIAEVTALAREIREKYPYTKVLIVTSLIDPKVLERAKSGCADSLWYKDHGEEEIRSVIYRTLNGEHVFPDVAPEVELNWITSGDISPRQLEMLRLYIHGMSYSEIARKMDCSASGVRWNFQEMIARAGYSCKEDLIAAALESKLIVTTLK